jgi:transcriptional regulator with XRE-family HTH domain
MSQRDLAAHCKTHGRKVTQGQISRLEQGYSRRPYMPLLRALANSLGVDIDDLLEEPGQ